MIAAIGATVTDKMIIKFLAARDTVAYFVGCVPGTHPSRATPLGRARVSSAIPPEARTPSRENAFHNASHHTKMPLFAMNVTPMHPTASVETRFLREPDGETVVRHLP